MIWLKTSRSTSNKMLQISRNRKKSASKNKPKKKLNAKQLKRPHYQLKRN